MKDWIISSGNWFRENDLWNPSDVKVGFDQV